MVVEKQCVKNILLWVLVLGLAAMWLMAGVNKLMDLSVFTESITRFRLTDQKIEKLWIPAAAVYLPWLEVVLAAAALLRPTRFAASFISLLLLMVFTAALISAWARGLDIQCGCFGDRLQLGHIKWGVVRNLGLMVWVVGLLILNQQTDITRSEA